MFLKAVNRRSVSKQLPLHLILIVPFVLQIFAAVGLTGYLSIRNGQKAVNAVASELRNEISDRINQKILTYLEKPYIINQTVASAIAEGQINLNDIRGLEHFFWRLVNQNTADSLQVATFDGTNVSIERLQEGYIVARTADKSNLPNRQIYRLDHQGQRAEVLKIQPFDPRTRPWYKAALKAGQPTWSEIFLSATNSSQVTIALSEPIYSQTGKFLGIQNSNFRISNIHEFLKKVKVGHSGQTFIIDRSGNLIASSLLKQPYIIRDSKVEQISAKKIENPIINFTAKALFNRFGNLRVIHDNQQLDFLLNGKRQFVQVSPIRDGRGIDWLSVVVVPESDFLAQINANTHTTILLCLAALGLATILGIYTSQRIARPIMLLSQASEAIAEGALHQNVEIYGVRELGILARSFNRMTQQLRESFTNLEQTNHQLEQRVEERTSELKSTLQNLQLAQAQIIQAEKMSSLGQLVAGVAHEINNPVNFIHGNVIHLYDYTHNLLDLIHLYQSEFPNSTSTIGDKIDDMDLEFLSEDMLKLLTSIQVGTERIREIVKSLRTFSRLDEAEVKRVDIHEGIESTLLILQHRLEAKKERPEIEVIRDYANLPLVECYSGQLNQVFMNILINAIDAIEQAKAQRTCEQNKHNPSQITIHTSVMNLDWVEIAIADNGLGMPKEVQQRMFDPFFTTKPVGKGTGMGMSISYQIIIDKHHGKLNCFSSLGEGTKFVIQIPVRQEDHKVPLLLGENLSNSKK